MSARGRKAQTGSKELAYKLEMVAEDLELAHRIALEAVETAVSEEA
jgi:hypothetical protein